MPPFLPRATAWGFFLVMRRKLQETLAVCQAWKMYKLQSLVVHAVELGRARWEHEQRQAALLAGELEFGGELAAATDPQGAKSLAETLWARSLALSSAPKKKREKRATPQEQIRHNASREVLVSFEAQCPGAGLSPQAPSQLFGPVFPARAVEARLRQVERPAVSEAEGSPMFAPPRNFQPRVSSSGFWSPVVPQFRDPGRITGNSTGVPGPDFQPLESTSPLHCTLTKNAPASPLKSTLAKLLDLKSPGMNTYKKRGVGAGALRANQHSTTHRVVVSFGTEAVAQFQNRHE